MEELIYLLQVSNDSEVQTKLASMLALDKAPTHVRIATMAPLSNFGYTADTNGAVLAVSDLGFVFGDAKNKLVPRSFVPWHNVAYVADGETLAKQGG